MEEISLIPYSLAGYYLVMFRFKALEPLQSFKTC